MSEDASPTVALLLDRISEARQRLDANFDSRSAAELSRPGADGWSGKDHLAHLAAWHQSLLGLLRGEDRREAMGLPPASAEHDTNALNDELFEQRRGLSWDEARRLFDDTYRDVVAEIERLGDDGIRQPYSYFQPNDPPYNPTPVLGWIAGNTFRHYDEHAEYVREIVASRDG